MLNALSFDIEDFYHGHVYQNIRNFEKLNLKQRVVNNTKIILNALKDHNIKATFFVLGVIAEEYPELLLQIHSHGHEIGSHGYRHTPIYQYETPTEFEDDIVKSKRIIEDIIQHEIRGYRAPSFSIRKDTLWALKIIRSAGFQYDSSIFPICHIRYGIPTAPTAPYIVIPGLIEVPPATCTLFGNLRIPFGGAGYFRLYPYSITACLIYINRCRGQSNVFYFHPHDFDKTQPLESLKKASRWKRKIGLKGIKRKFISLLSTYEFITIGQMADKYKN